MFGYIGRYCRTGAPVTLLGRLNSIMHQTRDVCDSDKWTAENAVKRGIDVGIYYDLVSTDIVVVQRKSPAFEHFSDSMSTCAELCMLWLCSDKASNCASTTVQ